MFVVFFIDRLLKKMLYVFVRAYQVLLSPLFPSSCRFYPTCSTYSLEALEKKPFLLSLKVIFFRILKCHPFSKGGHDPVK